MKSIVALLALVAVAHAGVVLEDGYVGSWFDTMEVDGATDLVAPTATAFEYTGLDEGTDSAAANVTFYGDSLYVSFETDEEYIYVAGCELKFTLWSADESTELNVVTCSCDPSYYSSGATGYGTCYFASYIQAGTYMAELTIWDYIGNWRTVDSTADAELMDVMVYNNRVDFMPPVITASAPSADVDLVIPAMNEDADTAGAFVVISMSAHDNDGTDDWSSGVASAGVWITEGDDEEAMWLPLIYDTYNIDDDDNTVRDYSVSVQFYNWADEGEWSIDSFGAVDTAGNWATPVAGPFVVSLTTEVTAEDSGRPPQCDTFGIGQNPYTTYTSSEYDVINSAINDPESFSTSYVYFNMECNNDYTGYNYAGALFASPQVQLAGATEAASLWVQTEDGWLPPEQMTIGYGSYEEDIYSVAYPGSLMGGAGDTGYWYDIWAVYDGYPVGEYTLDRVYTTTETGAVQVYDAALGAASSVVPSVVIVAVALVAAFL